MVALVIGVVSIVFQILVWSGSIIPSWDIITPIWLFFLGHILFLLVISPLLGTYSYLIKVEALNLAERSEPPLKFLVRKLPTLMFTAISWVIPSVAIAPSPLFYLSIASASISDYDGLNPIIESYNRYMEDWKRKLRNIPRDHLTVVVSSLIGIVAFVIMNNPVGRVIAIVSCTVPIIIILSIVREVSEVWINWGLKLCPMCKTWNPLEAVYCRNCGLRFKY